MWPASAMLTGSGVALILRVPGTPLERPLEHLQVVRVRGCRRLLAAHEVRHPLPRLARLQPVERRAGRRVHRVRQHADRTARLLVGSTEDLDDRGVRRDPGGWAADHRPPATARRGGDVLARPRGRCRAARGLRSLHDRALGVRACLRVRLLAGDRHVTGGADLHVLHDHGPEDVAGRACRPRHVRPPRRGGQHPADGGPDHRVRHQGRPARRPGGRVRGSSDPRPAGSRATIRGGPSRPVRDSTGDGRSSRCRSLCGLSFGWR